MPPFPAEYELLPTAEDTGDKVEYESLVRRRRIARAKELLSRVLALLAIMFLGYQGLWSFVKSSFKFLHSKPCHGTSGSQRNLTSLPSHFTLPSGDKIPSVALGTIYVFERTCVAHTTRFTHIGVWKATPGEVRPAVKAALQAGYRHIDGAWVYRVCPPHVISIV